jgi:hypothetical protein
MYVNRKLKYRDERFTFTRKGVERFLCRMITKLLDPRDGREKEIFDT